MPEIDLEPTEYRTKRPHAVWSPAIWLFEVLPAYFGVRRRQKREAKQERDAWYRATTPLWLRILVFFSGPWFGGWIIAGLFFNVPLLAALLIGAVPVALVLIVALVLD